MKDNQRKEINKLAEKGCSDKFISEHLSIDRTSVSYTTTAYWENKMKNKNKND